MPQAVVVFCVAFQTSRRIGAAPAELDPVRGRHVFWLDAFCTSRVPYLYRVRLLWCGCVFHVLATFVLCVSGHLVNIFVFFCETCVVVVNK